MNEDFKFMYFQKCAELKLPPNLEIVNLIRNNSHALESLGTLSLDNMKLCDQDLVPLLSALEETKSVKNLILTRNQIKDLRIFERLVQNNTALEGIDLSENPFTEEMAKGLISLLGTKSNIKWFNLNKSPSDKKKGSKTHKKSESIGSRTKISPMKSPPSLPLNNIHQRRPVPKKPNETGNRVFFRLNLYSGPQSARLRTIETEPDQDLSDLRRNKGAGQKKGKNEESFQTIHTSRNENDMFLSRVDWILRIKEIYYALFSETRETVFHKLKIIDCIRKKDKGSAFVTEETYKSFHFEKGYSLSQVLQAIEAADNIFLKYDDIIELICNIDKPKAPVYSQTPQPKESTKEFSYNKPYLQSFKNTPENKKFYPNASPIQEPTSQTNMLDYVECSFSFENNNNNAGSGTKRNMPKSNNAKKPPKAMSRSSLKGVLRPSSHHNESSNSLGITQNIDIRQCMNNNSPTEIETARFKKESSQLSSNKDKHESYRLEISSEISSLIDAGLRYNDSYDIDSTINENNTTAKLMSALGDTPKNLSNLNIHTMAHDKTSFLDQNVTSFTIHEKTPQSNALKGTLNQMFGNKIFRSDSGSRYQLIPNNTPKQGLKFEQMGLFNVQIPMPRDKTTPHTTKNARMSPNLVTKGANYEMNMRKSEQEIRVPYLNKIRNQVHEEIAEEPERSCNSDEFERLLEQTKSSLRNRKDEESQQILEAIKHFQIHNHDLYPLVSLLYNEAEAKVKLPHHVLAFKKLMKHIDVLNLANMNNIHPTLQNVLSSRLKILNLSYNNLTHTDFLSSCKSLEFLNLSNNRLKFLPTIGNCIKLKEIYISYNRLTELPNFFGLDDMTIISASFNQINSLENIANLTLNRKLHILDLTGNPTTKRANYQSIMKNILPQLKAIDVGGESFSEFKPYKDICFSSSLKLNPSQSKKIIKPEIATLKLENSFDKQNSASRHSLILSESEKSENCSPAQKKKIKAQIPKLNIKSLQSIDFSTIRSCGSNLGSTKPSLQFNGTGETNKEIRDFRLATERTPSSEDSQSFEKKFHSKSKERSNKKLDIEFLSHRENISIKLPTNPTQNNALDLRKPVRVVHLNIGNENNGNGKESVKRPVNKSREKNLLESPVLMKEMMNLNIGSAAKRVQFREEIESQKENINMNIPHKENSKPIVKPLKLSNRQW